MNKIVISVFAVLIVFLLVLGFALKIQKNYEKKNKKNPKAKGKAGEKRVKDRLSTVSKNIKHKEINDLILKDDEGNTHQIDHVEIRENGIFCIETKNYSGLIFGSKNQPHWTQCLNKSTREQIPNALIQNNGHVKAINKVLNHHYMINSVVVMVQNNADKIDASNVININNLKSYLENYKDGTNLSSSEIDDIYNTLINAGAGLTNKEHLENLRNRGIKSK